MPEEIGHVYIPAYIMARTDLSLLEKLLYGKIMGLVGGEGYCFASNEWLSKQLERDAKTIGNMISRLVEKGLMSREVIRNEKGAIIMRKLYPLYHQSETPPPEIGGTPPPEIVEGIQDIYLSKNRELPNYKGDYREWLEEFNRVFKTNYKSNASLGNYTYWRKEYSQEEMLKVIPNIRFHEWLSDKAKPDLILRQRDTHGNPVDRIGELLSTRDPRRYA